MFHIRLWKSVRILTWRHIAVWGNGKLAVPEHLFKGMGSHSIKRLHKSNFNKKHIWIIFLSTLLQLLSLILCLQINTKHNNSQRKVITQTLLAFKLVLPDCSSFPCGVIQTVTSSYLKMSLFFFFQSWAKQGARGPPSSITILHDTLLTNSKSWKRPKLWKILGEVIVICRWSELCAVNILYYFNESDTVF